MKTLLIATIVVCLLEASSPSSIAAADKRQENLVILTT